MAPLLEVSSFNSSRRNMPQSLVTTSPTVLKRPAAYTYCLPLCRTVQTTHVRAAFVHLSADMSQSQDGARKALEQAFQGKNSIAKKWEEEIKKRELAGGDGGGVGGASGGGGGWGGSGGDDDMGEDFGQDEPWDWEEAGQTFMATFMLILLYVSITHGPKQVFRLAKLLFRYIRQGFRLRKIPDEYLRPENPEEDLEDEYGYDSEDDEEDDLVPATRADTPITKAQDADVKTKQNSLRVAPKDNQDDEDDELLSAPPPDQRISKGEEKWRKRKLDEEEKIFKLLTPKERRQLEGKD